MKKGIKKIFIIAISLSMMLSFSSYAWAENEVLEEIPLAEEEITTETDSDTDVQNQNEGDKLTPEKDETVEQIDVIIDLEYGDAYKKIEENPLDKSAQEEQITEEGVITDKRDASGDEVEEVSDLVDITGNFSDDKSVNKSSKGTIEERAENELDKESEGESEGVSYLLEDGILTIFGTGPMEDYSSTSDIPWYSQRSKIKKIVVRDGITSIGDHAFDNCYKLENVIIPESVTSIGDYAFYVCSGDFTSINIPDNVTSIGDYAFASCYFLENINIPDNVTSIGDYAFSNCHKLANITIPESVTSLGSASFAGCISLKDITIPKNVTNYGSHVFASCSSLESVTIQEGATSIGNREFLSCSSLTNIIIPDSVTSIGEYAFHSCTSLASINIPGSVTDIEDSAFYNCTNLTNIIIGEGVKRIKHAAFRNCDSLTNITIPSSVTAIGFDPFYECDSLKYIFFCGTQEQWEKWGVSIGSAIVHYNTDGHIWNSNYTIDIPATEDTEGSASIHCSVCDAIKPGSEWIINAGIDNKDITECVIYGLEDKIYTGEEIKPELSFYHGDDILVEGADYKLTYHNNINVGTASVLVEGLGRYFGSISLEFQIERQEILPEITLSQTEYTYNGTTQRPEVSVKVADKELDATSYTVVFPSYSVDVGTYNVDVTLEGNYSGAASASYTIKEKEITPLITLSKTSFTYNEKTQKPKVTVKDGDTVLTSSCYTVTFPSSSIAAGTYKVKVTMKGNYKGSASASYTIKVKKITPVVTLSKSSFTYNGKVQKPKITVKYGGNVIPSTQYTIKYPSGLKNVGTYKVVITMKKNYSGTKTVSYKILPKKTSITSLKAGKNSITVKWGKQTAQVTGYQIQYSVKSDFSKSVKKTVSKSTTISKALTGLTKGYKYYVRVRTYKTVNGTNYYSAWSASKYVKVTTGTTEKISKIPTITIEPEYEKYEETIKWNKITGATGYQVYCKIGENGSWEYLKSATKTSTTNKVKHRVYYYYKVRAYKEKADGSRIYGGFSKNKRFMLGSQPYIELLPDDEWDANTSAISIYIINRGKYTLRVYARNAYLDDLDYDSFDRRLTLINTSDFEPVSYIDIGPDSGCVLMFSVKGNPTFYDPKNSIIGFEFKYDGIDYQGWTSRIVSSVTGMSDINYNVISSDCDFVYD